MALVEMRDEDDDDDTTTTNTMPLLDPPKSHDSPSYTPSLSRRIRKWATLFLCLTLALLLIKCITMVSSGQFSLKALVTSLTFAIGSASPLVTSGDGADGLTTFAGSAPASTAVVTTGGITTTYRAIPTLSPSVDETRPVTPTLDDPHAVDPQSVCPGYKASNVEYNPYGFSASLSLAGKACNVYGNDIEDLHLHVQYQSADRLSVKITPKYIGTANYTQYIIPSAYVNEPVLDHDAHSSVPQNDLQFNWSNEPSFSFSVMRRSTGDILFSTADTVLVFEDQFLEIATSMPENYNVQGLGEHIHPLRLGNNFDSTLWNADIGDVTDSNLYGTHPFYLDTRYFEVDPKTGNLTLLTSEKSDPNAKYTSYSHGVYLRNAHGHEVLLRPQNITWRTIGGSMDMYFFSGSTPAEVTQQYQKGAIGYPALQQYWTFGYHQCRWGYTNWSEMYDVWDNFKRFEIPLETLWNDIDLYSFYRDFENDPVRFGYEEGEKFLSMLRSNNQHYVPIVDSAIYHPNLQNKSDAYSVFTRGADANAFVLNQNDSLYIGAVWPGFTVFPDWRSEGAGPWWTYEFKNWHNKFAFDGAWIDMSEISSFCTGSCGTGKVGENPVHPPFALPGEPGDVIYTYPEDFDVTNATEAKSASSAEASQSRAATTYPSPTATLPPTKPTPGTRNVLYPPYAIRNGNGALPVHALSPAAKHADGAEDYDIHNLWGYEILNATRNALLETMPGKRPFIIGRSTFAGAGRLAGHWGGDNTSLFYYMYYSISQALSFSLFGIPMFGVDTCGFSGNSDEELCNRWMQLSAFFPFYRNHNTLSANSQEPYIWSSVITASKKAMSIRYSLLPYIYTLFYNANQRGDTVMRALAWEFADEPVFASVDRQFLLGPSLLVAPVLEPLYRNVSLVFPGIQDGTVWYDWYTQTAMDVAAGQNVTVDAPLGHIPLYVRSGSILPMQKPGLTTTETRESEWSLLVALSQESSATGQLYLDDGESLHPEKTKFVDLTANPDGLYSSGMGRYKDMNALANVTVMGVPKAPKKVQFNGETVSSMEYNSKKKALYITGLDKMTKDGAWNQDWALTW